MSRYIVYSHGFGVHKDARGLFTAIARHLPGFKHVLFEYNTVRHGMLTVMPLEYQVSLLKEEIERIKATDSEAEINIVGHSQGCIVVGLLQPTAEKILLLAPPEVFDKHLISNIFKHRDGVRVDENENYYIPRSDGTISLVPREYWDSLAQFKQIPSSLYRMLAQQSHVMIVRADRDEIIGKTDFDNLKPVIDIQMLGSNHDFGSGARDAVVDIAKHFFGTSEK